MSFVVIQKYAGWEYSSLVTNTEGRVLVFDTEESAQLKANEYRDAIVVGDSIKNVVTKKDMAIKFVELLIEIKNYFETP